MSTPWSRADEIAQRALAHPSPETRDNVISQECAGDAELAEHVQRLVELHDVDAHAGETVQIDPSSARSLPEVAAQMAGLKPEEAGDRIGHFKLLQQIGEGGFGTVWAADQEQPVRRRVALKIIKLGMDTKEVIARFEQERQALALMDHPNIARVFDAGATPWGRPFFVMEYVRGIRITDFCDQSQLSTEARLRLFISVCHAVQHAHQKGIIHRDLKPSNILVTLHDGAAVPKVIDFGIAKAVEQRLTDRTLFTRLEQMIGTPLYMSPEQAERSGLDIDTRTDIYALGVLVYEMLAGRTPFDPAELMRGGHEEICRMIREEEPPRPSDAIATMLSATKTQVAQRQSTTPSELVRRVRGDLDWIVMKALEKDRSRRYATANGLAKDVQRHLDSEPVLARPQSRVYRVQRFAKRYRAGVLAGAGIAVALIMGLAGSIWQARRAEREAQRANAALAELRETAPAFAAQAKDLALHGKFDEAIKALGYAMQLQPTATAYLWERASLFRSQLRLSEAARDYRRVAELNAGESAAQANAAFCEQLSAAPREAGGGFPRAGVAELHRAMIEERRPPAEMLLVARQLGRESELMREVWLERLKSLPVGPAKPLAERLTVGSHGLLDLDLSGSQIEDLAPLAEVPLGVLNLNGCKAVRSIAPLQGKHLRSLELTGTRVASLEPLTGMKTLERLALATTLVDDLRPLKGLALTWLELGNTRVADLSPLEGMQLKMLECSFTAVADFTPLARVSVKQLALQGARVGDLGFVRDMPLEVLILAGARDVRNLQVLNAATSLEVLILPGNPLVLPDAEISAIESLRQHPSLRRLSCRLPAGSDANSAESANRFWQEWDETMRWWRPLRAAGISLNTNLLRDGMWQVSLQAQPIADLSIFSGARIRSLDLVGCREVTNLSPLASLPLTTLSIAKTGVTDLTPLHGLKLESLWMAGTNVADLSPLRGMPLKQLYMDECPRLSDISPLRELPDLEEVILPEIAEDVPKLRPLPKLQRLSYSFDWQKKRAACSAEAFWRENHDLTWLRVLRARHPQLAAEKLEQGTWKLAPNDGDFSDLTLLRDARISVLWLNGTNVSALGGLEKLPLRSLRCDATPSMDVSVLARVDSLEAIVLPRGASGLSVLKKLPALKRISFQADARGEPTLEAAAFWTALEKEGPR